MCSLEVGLKNNTPTGIKSSSALTTRKEQGRALPQEKVFNRFELILLLIKKLRKKIHEASLNSKYCISSIPENKN